MSVERAAKTVNGWAMLVVDIVLYVAATALIVYSFVEGSVGADGETVPIWWMLVTGCVVLAAAIVVSPGFFTLQPNEARVLILFGDYKGTSRETGFRWGNPFFANGSATSSSAALAKAAEQDRRRGQEGQVAEQAADARALQGVAACPHPQRRPAQGERQARQPGGDRGGRGLARRGHRPGRVRRRRLRAVRLDAERDGPAPRGHRLRLRPPGEEGDEITLRSSVADVSQALKVELAGAPRQGRRGGRRGAAHAPRLRAGDRPGDAPPPAGRGDHRRAPARSSSAP